MGKHSEEKAKYLSKSKELHSRRKKEEINEDKDEKRQIESEKEKIKSIYGISEKRFNKYLRYSLTQGDPAVAMFILLETRLANVLYRSGFAADRSQAWQMIEDGQVYVNGKRVDKIYHVKPSDLITVEKEVYQKQVAGKPRPSNLPGWISRKNGIIRIEHQPGKRDVRKDIDFISIIRFYI